MTDNLDVSGLRSAAQSAGTDLTNQISGVPGMMADLRKSLTSIYAKDNPLIQARDEALSKYMSTADTTRADLLTPNLPMVAGSPLTLSPTQQNAIVSGRQSAALAPLLGLNQAVTAGYGNIKDILDAANVNTQYKIKAAEANLANAVNAYHEAVQQEQFNREFTEKQRQFDIEADIKRKQAGIGNDFFSTLFGQPPPPPAPNPWVVVPTTTPAPITIPGQTGEIYPYTPASTNVSIPILSGIGDWWHSLWNQPQTQTNLNPTGTGLNFLGLGGSTGPVNQ